MTRYRYAACLCGCDRWIVIDSLRHAVVGTTRNAWDASKAAMHLNEGRVVLVAPEVMA